MDLNKSNLSSSFANNTLVITVIKSNLNRSVIKYFSSINNIFLRFKYSKPKEFIVMENLIKAELSKTKASKDGDVANLNDCKTS